MKTVFAAVALLSGCAFAEPLGNPAVSPATSVPFHETVFGVEIEDPYRWMEDPAKLPEMTEWTVKSSDATIADLARLPERPSFVVLMDRAWRAGASFSDPASAGGKLFFMRQDPDGQVPRLMVREAGQERVLFDPEPGQTIGNYSVSPDARTVAVQVSAGGREMGAIYFLDVATGARKGAPIDQVWSEIPAAWLPRGMVAYTQSAVPAPGTGRAHNTHGALIAPGDAGPGRFVLGTGVAGAPSFDPSEVPIIQTAPTSSYAVGLGTGALLDERVFVASADALAKGSPHWRVAIGSYEDQATHHALLGDDIYLIIAKGSPNGRVERRDLKSPGSPATVVLPAGDLVLTGIEATWDGIYVAAHRDGIGHLLFLPGGHGNARDVALPFEGDLSDLQADRTDGESVLFGLEGWSTPTTFFRARAGRALPIGLASAVWEGAANVVASRDEAVSADGTHVPMVVLLPPGGRRGPLPTILEGYGAYGDSVVAPSYDLSYATWVAHGGAFAFCGTRGGNERGRVWQDAGRALNKPNAQADYIACAERLEAAGYTRPSMLVAMGKSAGGAVVPPATLRRPDLFAGLIERVGLVNPTRLAAAENGVNQYHEFGDPGTPEGFAVLDAEDAYRMLRTASDMPDTLVTVGLNDLRVAPWMGTKFAARARAKFGDRRLVLLRVEIEGGHETNEPRDTWIAEQADIFTFAWYVTHRRGAPGG
jgi:prolyl oligopeptidase